MNEWLDRLFGEQDRRVEAANAAKHKRDSAEVALAEKIDSFWASFLQELRERADEYNTRAKPDRQVTISTPEPNSLVLRNQGINGGEFSAQLHKHERRGEVVRWIGAAIQTINCPIAARDYDNELAFRADDGKLHDQKSAARILLESYFRWTLGLIDEAPPKGQQPIGFGG